MLNSLRQFLSGVLLLAAASSLVIGPSPAAVQAENRNRLDVENAAAERAATGSSSDSPAQPRDDSDSLASFVAPASAKPAQSQWSNTVVAVSGAAASVIVPPYRGDQLLRTQDASLRDLHRPAYRAHAPPVA